MSTANGINADGTVQYRGYTLAVGEIQVHIWNGRDFLDTTHGEPTRALARAKRLIDSWVDDAR